MFTSFAAIDSTSDGRPSGATPVPTSSVRPRRQQVSRACVSCRTHRIKCDPYSPCTNCKIRSRKCSHGQTQDEGNEKFRTYPLAIKEIEKLKLRVRELEQQLNNATITDKGTTEAESVRTRSELSLTLPLNLDPLEQHGGNKKFYNWDFIRTQTVPSSDQFYGYSSSFYFTHQITSYLESALQQRPPDIQQFLGSRRLPGSVGIEDRNLAGDDALSHGQYKYSCLSQLDEEKLVEVYFSSYQTVMPVLDQTEFKVFHKCLWETIDAYRKPSALADIVIALAIQHSTELESWDSHRSRNCVAAGQLLYRRCQNLLADELEAPSIQTFQSQLLSAIWLLNASCRNMAHSVLAMGIRTGIILGLHLEPPEDLHPSQTEFRRLLWWAMYSLEIRLAMELGRPLAVSITMVTVNLPNEDARPTDSSPLGISQVHSGKVSTYLVYYIRLILAARAIYITFYRKCAEVLSHGPHKSLFHDRNALEMCAEFLTSKISYLESWLDSTPVLLKTLRKQAGHPFSNDDSALDFDFAAPIWVSRQRVFLELEYHDLMMNLYRPFVCFTSQSSTSIPLTSKHAISCANHAITMTSIIHQTATESDYLHGWHRVFDWQWGAFLSLIGYILAFPAGSRTPAARRAVSLAINTFELLPNQLKNSSTAAHVARDLSAKVDLYVERFRSSLVPDHPTTSLPTMFPLTPGNDLTDGPLTAADLNFLSFAQDEESSLFPQIPTAYSGSPLALDMLADFGGWNDDTSYVPNMSVASSTNMAQL